MGFTRRVRIFGALLRQALHLEEWSHAWVAIGNNASSFTVIPGSILGQSKMLLKQSSFSFPQASPSEHEEAFCYSPHLYCHFSPVRTYNRVSQSGSSYTSAQRL